MDEQTRDLSRWINQFTSDANTALTHFHKKDDLVTFQEIEQALLHVLQLERVNNLFYLYLPASKIIELLNEFDFAALRPQKLCEVRFDESLIPDDVPILLTEKQVKAIGEVWTIHRNDVDTFPSNPHAHNYDSDIVADLSNGKLYRKSTRNEIGKLRRKKLLMLRAAIKNVQLPDLIA